MMRYLTHYNNNILFSLEKINYISQYNSSAAVLFHSLPWVEWKIVVIGLYEVLRWNNTNATQRSLTNAATESYPNSIQCMITNPSIWIECVNALNKFKYYHFFTC